MPKLGKKVASSIDTASSKVSSGINAVSTKIDSAIHKTECIDIDDLLQYVDKSKTTGNCRRVNGTGTTFGGHMKLPGFSNLGFIKKYFSIVWIPLFPLGTYLVQDWNGYSGSFIGKIASEDADKFIDQNKQRTAVALGAVATAAKAIALIIGVSLLISSLR